MSDVKVGDLLRDETLLEVGMLCQWLGDQLSWVHGPGVWAFDKPGGASAVETAVRTRGVRILALPPKAEIALGSRWELGDYGATTVTALHPETNDVTLLVECKGNYHMRWDASELIRQARPLPPKAEEPPATPAPKCSPGCTPATPCRTEGVCPVWREPALSSWYEWNDTGTLVRSDLPAARPPRSLPLRHAGNAGFAIWGRR